MLLVVKNLRVDEATITAHTGETVVLAPKEYIVVECPNDRFAYYEVLRRLGFDISIRKTYVHCTTKQYGESDKKPVEKVVEKKTPKITRPLTQHEQEELEYGVLPDDIKPVETVETVDENETVKVEPVVKQAQPKKEVVKKPTAKKSTPKKNTKK